MNSISQETGDRNISRAALTGRVNGPRGRALEMVLHSSSPHPRIFQRAHSSRSQNSVRCWEWDLSVLCVPIIHDLRSGQGLVLSNRGHCSAENNRKHRCSVLRTMYVVLSFSDLRNPGPQILWMGLCLCMCSDKIPSFKVYKLVGIIIIIIN